MIRDFEDVIKGKNKKTIWLADQQGKYFKGLRKRRNLLK